MINILRKIIKQISSQPKTVFLIDRIGALTTAFFLFAVLINNNENFGMSEIFLTDLSLIEA